jgi:choline dehydrogenase-like flavoprotein
MHSQSSGKISLKSAEPDVAPNIDMNCLSHPYDRRVLIESLRKTVEFIENSTLPVENIAVGPSGMADEDILVLHV